MECTLIFRDSNIEKIKCIEEQKNGTITEPTLFLFDINGARAD